MTRIEKLKDLFSKHQAIMDLVLKRTPRPKEQLPKTESTAHIFKPASPSQKVATA